MPDSVTVAATGGNTLAVGNVELRVPSPVLSSRLRLAAFVDAGSVWQRGAPNSSFSAPGHAGSGPADQLRRSGRPGSTWPTTRTRLQSGTLFQIDSLGTLTAVPGQGLRFLLDRKDQLTFHFAVGQAF